MNKRQFVVHPFLFAVYSIAGIYSQNASQVPLHWLFRPLVISVVIASVVYAALNRKYKDAGYAGWGTSLFIVWLFSGHVYRLLLESSTFWRTVPGGMLALTASGLPLGVLASRLAWGKLSSHRTITMFLNTVSVVLTAFSVWTIASTLYFSKGQVLAIRERVSRVEVELSPPGQTLSDIYLIVLDGYGREDILRDLYGYDNSEFIEFLRGKGFYVADRSTANYPQTELSISSSMNLQSLDAFVTGFGDTIDRSPLRELMRTTVIRRVLDEQGYQFVALPSAALFAQIDDADIYYSLTPGGINEFEGLVLSSTIAGVFVESWGWDLPIQGYELHRKYILFSLEKLHEVAEIPGPKFVFAHLLSPHPPFIFNAEGKNIVPDRPYSTWDASLYPGGIEEYKKGYTDQMTFLNHEIMKVVTGILENSATPPIIILQGDHGPGAYYDTLKLDTSCLSERFSILNAYYFPDGNYELLYPSITPINTFRVILNQYFGAELDLLEDRNYFAGWLSPYQFIEVSDKIDDTCVPPP
jgi:hypothetical protein